VEQIERKSVKQANELVKVAVNASPPQAAVPLQAITWRETLIACISTYCLEFTHTHTHTHTQRKRQRGEKGRKRELFAYSNIPTKLYNMRYIESLRGTC